MGYEGEYFRVRGPLNLPRCPQGRPLLVQAGSSPDGREFAARYAEAVFTAQQTLQDGQEFYADLKARARRMGRHPDEIKILPGIVPVIGSTKAEARALDDELESLIIPEHGLEQLARVLEGPASRLQVDQGLPDEVFARPAAVEGAQSDLPAARCSAPSTPGRRCGSTTASRPESQYTVRRAQREPVPAC